MITRPPLFLSVLCGAITLNALLPEPAHASSREKELEGLIKHFQGTVERYEDRVMERKVDLEKAKTELEEAKERAQPAIESLASTKKMIESERKLVEEIGGLETEIREKSALLEAYKAAFRPRFLAENRNLGNITLKNGQSLQGAVIAELQGDRVRLAHQGGFAVVTVADLPDAVQNLFTPSPAPVASDLEPTAVLSRKPERLKSKSELEADYERQSKSAEERREMELAAEKEARKRALAERQAAEEAEAQKKAAELKAREEQLAAYRRRANELRNQIVELEKSLYKMRAAKEEKRRSMTSGISASASDLDKALQPYTQRIAAIEKQIQESAQELRVLVRP